MGDLGRTGARSAATSATSQKLNSSLPGDDEGPAVGGTATKARNSEDPFAAPYRPVPTSQSRTRSECQPQLAARRPSTSGADLSSRMDAQLHRHRPPVSRSTILLGPPSTVTAPGARPSGLRREEGPTQGGQGPRRAEAPPLRAVARDRPRGGPSDPQVKSTARAVVPASTAVPSRFAIEEGINGPRGQQGDLAAAAQVPHAGASVDVHDQQATVRTDVTPGCSCARASPSLLTRVRYSRLGVTSSSSACSPWRAAPATHRPSPSESEVAVDHQGQMQQRPTRRGVPEPQGTVPGVGGQEAALGVKRQVRDGPARGRTGSRPWRYRVVTSQI